MRFFVAKSAPQNDSGVLAPWEVQRRFALDNAGGVVMIGKAVAEPPHSKMDWAMRALRTLRESAEGGRRASRGWRPFS
jgi:hypothetical protein